MAMAVASLRGAFAAALARRQLGLAGPGGRAFAANPCFDDPFGSILGLKSGGTHGVS